jgi:hypothetical protein
MVGCGGRLNARVWQSLASLSFHHERPSKEPNNHEYELPTVLTTSLGQGPNGPFIPEVVSMFPDVPVIESSHASITVSKRLAATALPAR